MYQFEAIGTHWTIDINQPLAPPEQAGLFSLIEQRIAEFDQAYSRFRPDSIVTAMSKRAGVYELPSDAKPMLDLYERLYKLTDGAVTPLIGQLISDAGYDASYSLQPKPNLATPPRWEEVLEWQAPHLTVKQPCLLDFGALGKGYLIDIVGELIEAQGIRSYCIDAGGDIRYRNPKHEPLRIGLENPRDFEQAIGVATIGNQSLCGSSGSRRKWAQFHHIINPHTKSSPTEVIATWTVASTTLLADALATCLFLVPAKSLHAEFIFEYLILKSDFTVEKSSFMPAELFRN